MSLEYNRTLIRSFFEEADRLRTTPVELCAPDFTAYIGGDPPMDLEAFEKYLRPFYAAFSNWSRTFEDVVAERDRVAFRVVSQATHSKAFMGTPASGKQITLTSIGIARIVAGKIVEWWNSPDRLGLMQQIGALPAKGEAGK